MTANRPSTMVGMIPSLRKNAKTTPKEKTENDTKAIEPTEGNASANPSKLDDGKPSDPSPSQSTVSGSDARVPVASSSWIQRIVSYPSQTTIVSQRSTTNDQMATSDGDGSQKTPPADRAESGGQGGDGDDNDNGDDNNAEANKRAAEGIWAWLGYGKPPAEAGKPNQTKTPIADVPVADNPATNQKKEPASSDVDSTATKQTTKDSPLTNEQSVNRSSWRSYFWSSKNSGDSVVVEVSKTTTQDQDALLNETRPASLGARRASTPEKNSGKSSETSSRSKNIVLPTIRSQFTAPVEPTPTTLLSKAISAVNAMLMPSKATPPERQKHFMTSQLAKWIDALGASKQGDIRKRFVVVGVHGWFPMKLVRSMIGEPTGTSGKFCEQMNTAIRHYFFREFGVDIPQDAITCIPLEGEGKVEERVEKLHKALLNQPAWLEALTSADVVFWTTHSQGTPVSVILLQRLLEEKRITVSTQSICLLAMAGISHGPFPWLKGNLLVKYFEADAARELFEFMDSESQIAKTFQQSFASILEQNIKVVLVGSMQDQVVPLYSAIMTGTSHPNILRALYIDGHVYSDDDFLIHLLTFALRLRNAGYSDHGLLTYVSEVLAGNLYAWEGAHSTIYEERDVYAIAVQFLFETVPFGRLARRQAESASQVPTVTDKQEKVSPTVVPFHAKTRQNPFYLPWAMRGICDDTSILGDSFFRNELDQLRALLERWVPTSAKLREIKFRLEPLKARL